MFEERESVDGRFSLISSSSRASSDVELREDSLYRALITTTSHESTELWSSTASRLIHGHEKEETKRAETQFRLSF